MFPLSNPLPLTNAEETNPPVSTRPGDSRHSKTRDLHTIEIERPHRSPRIFAPASIPTDARPFCEIANQIRPAPLPHVCLYRPIRLTSIRFRSDRVTEHGGRRPQRTFTTAVIPDTRYLFDEDRGNADVLKGRAGERWSSHGDVSQRFTRPT